MAYLDRLLATDEQILFATRQHWFVLAGEVVRHLVVTVVIIVGLDLLTTGVPSLTALLGTVDEVHGAASRMEQHVRGLLPALELMVFAGGSLLLLWTVVVWQSVQSVVTSRRVIHVRGVFYKRTLDSSLDMINDIGLTQSWLGRLMDYGNIEIMTASEEGTNVLPALAQPLRFKQALAAARRAFRLTGTLPYIRPDAMPQTAVVYSYLDCLFRWAVLSETDFRRLTDQVALRAQADGTLRSAPRAEPNPVEPQ